MTDARFTKLRILRLVIWALLMGGTSMVVGWYNPRKAMYVPCVFLAVMVPIVLLPLKNQTKDKG